LKTPTLKPCLPALIGRSEFGVVFISIVVVAEDPSFFNNNPWRLWAAAFWVQLALGGCRLVVADSASRTAKFFDLLKRRKRFDLRYRFLQ
jgi:hypothetical protein